jgi:hypothetical protein
VQPSGSESREPRVVRGEPEAVASSSSAGSGSGGSGEGGGAGGEVRGTVIGGAGSEGDGVLAFGAPGLHGAGGGAQSGWPAAAIAVSAVLMALGGARWEHRRQAVSL